MTAVDDLVAIVRSRLYSHYPRQLYRQLRADITDVIDAITFNAAPPAGIGDGSILELDYELVYVLTAASDSPYTHQVMRGFGTAPAAEHVAGILCSYDPLFPRQSIYEAMRGAVLSIDDNIYKPTETTLTFGADVNAVDLDATGTVYAIRATNRAEQAGGAYGLHEPQIELVRNAPVTDFPSGVAARLVNGATYNGAVTVGVTYAQAYTEADFAKGDTSGLTELLAEAVGAAAMSQLIADKEMGRLSLSSQGQTRHPEDVPASSFLRTSQYYEQLAARRFSDERARLLALYPWVAR